MENVNFKLPDFLKGVCPEERYWKWLNREAGKLFNQNNCSTNGRIGVPTRFDFKLKIHKAVLRCQMVDAYSGLLLNWKLLAGFDSKAPSFPMPT